MSVRPVQDHTDEYMKKPIDAKLSGFWLVFAVSLAALWIACLAFGLGEGFFLLSVVAAALMGLRHGRVFRPTKSVLVTPPRECRDSLREQLRPQAQRTAAIWALMAAAMLIAACIVFLSDSIQLRGTDIKGDTAVIFGFVCLFVAARAGFAAYESLLRVRTLNPSKAEALTAHARYITYSALALSCIVLLIWI